MTTYTVEEKGEKLGENRNLGQDLICVVEPSLGDFGFIRLTNGICLFLHFEVI